MCFWNCGGDANSRALATIVCTLLSTRINISMTTFPRSFFVLPCFSKIHMLENTEDLSMFASPSFPKDYPHNRWWRSARSGHWMNIFMIYYIFKWWHVPEMVRFLASGPLIDSIGCNTHYKSSCAWQPYLIHSSILFRLFTPKHKHWFPMSRSSGVPKSNERYPDGDDCEHESPMFCWQTTDFTRNHKKTEICCHEYC